MVPVTTSTSYSDRLRQWRENRWNIYMEIIFTFGKTMSVSFNGALTEKTEKLQVNVWGQINNKSQNNYA